MSQTDDILAWLAAGERAVPAYTAAAIDQRFGPDWPARLAGMTIQTPEKISTSEDSCPAQPPELRGEVKGKSE